MKILITGIAGFIGFHVAKELEKEHDVYGIDAMTDFYDVDIKIRRIQQLETKTIERIIYDNLNNKILSGKFDLIIHLAAQAGVPFSKDNPLLTAINNVNPTIKIFEYAQKHNIPVIYASSSSVYECKSLYSLTKKWNEETAAYYKNVNSVGLRFFSIYGEYGRPDQVFYKWIEALKNGQEIQLNGSRNQDVRRNFTHVSDVVKFIKMTIDFVTKNTGQSVLDVKNGKNISLSSCLSLLEKYMGVNAKVKRCELKDYDPLVVSGGIESIDGIDIKQGLKQLTEHLEVYNEK